MIQRVHLQVDLNAIQDNYNVIRSYVHPAEVMVILKADAYGLGVKPIAQALRQAGATWYGVSNLQEALEIKQVLDDDPKVNLLILGSVMKEEVPQALENHIILPIENLPMAKWIDKEALRRKMQARVHLVVDTGMGRLGFYYADLFKHIQALHALKSLHIEGMYSHFSMAYDSSHPQTKLQIRRFESTVKDFRRHHSFTWAHLSNSDGINHFSDARLDMVRTGINLYGLFDVGHQAYRLREALRLSSTLIALRELPKGATIGYGMTYVLEDNMRLGTVPVGYADGFPYTDCGNKGHVLIHGRFCSVVGRVSMDYIVVNLNDLPEASLGDEVILIGHSHGKSISLTSWAELKQTHLYEVIASFGSRLHKTYVSKKL